MELGNGAGAVDLALTCMDSEPSNRWIRHDIVAVD
jgi:hypothetical protein